MCTFRRVFLCVILFALVCWKGDTGTGGANKLGKLVKKASSVVELDRKLDGVEAVTGMKMKGMLKG